LRGQRLSSLQKRGSDLEIFPSEPVPALLADAVFQPVFFVLPLPFDVVPQSVPAAVDNGLAHTVDNSKVSSVDKQGH
jgi:hypothetical protein